ncbi:hypothetical protein EVG20_g4962 [Dentipellis fragilis]|uniref:YDG domain-containing protein n=1 Tax=Dentipellis fragilis TaxID=205917 RepID=A0A4Y9YWM9_9AGAM|nr:hypothetical protein EVG20_g4962 [Dentipellis fragilis]
MTSIEDPKPPREIIDVDSDDHADSEPDDTVTPSQTYPEYRLPGEPYVGHIKGTFIGQTWRKRKEAAEAGIHRQVYAGIWAGKNYAYSVVISGGYDDDSDEGETILYTGSGGRSRNQGPFGGNSPQTEDQSFAYRSNAALLSSCRRMQPVRVIRGLYDEEAKLYYRYDGLYDVTSAELVEGSSGFMVCQFRFEVCHLLSARVLRATRSYSYSYGQISQRRHDQEPLPYIGWPDAVPASIRKKTQAARRRSSS